MRNRRGFLTSLGALFAPLAASAAPAPPPAPRLPRSESVTLTAYCPCEICCGRWARYGLTKAQTKPVEGFTLASRHFPIGTVIRLDGRLHQVHDLGGPIARGFDVFHHSHQDAKRFGVKRRRVQIVHVPRAQPKTQEVAQ